jgi:hypothetical protein
LAQIVRELETFRYKLHGFKLLVAMIDRVIARAKKLKK